MTFTLTCISSDLEFWLVNNTSICENSELKVFQKTFFFFVKYVGNWPNDLLTTNVYQALESCW